MCSNRNNSSSENEIERDFVLNKSTVSNLILQINDILKKPNIDEQLSRVLDKFLENLKKSDRYLESGIFTINFAEAGLLLEKSCVLYGKKMDILWNDVKESLQRLHSYKSKNISDEKELNEKMNHFRRRKTLFQQDNLKDSVSKFTDLLYETGSVPNLPQIVGSACKTLENLWSEATQSSLKLKRLRAKVVPLVITYIKKTPIYSENDNKKLCNYQDLCLNLYESGNMLHDDKTTQMYNLRHLIDDILQTYLAQHEITYTKLAECNMWPDFKEFLQSNISKRPRILLKKQRERMNGGWDRKRPLIAQRPPVDLSMLHVFGDLQVNVVSTDDNGDEEIAGIPEADSDSDVTMSPASPAKSYVSRRTSEMHSEADSAFHDGSFEDDEERNVRSKQEEVYIQGSTATESRKNTIGSDDRGYFEDSLRGKTPGNDTDCTIHSDSIENEVSREEWGNDHEEIEVTQDCSLHCNSEDEQENGQLRDDDHNFRDKYEDKLNEKNMLSKIVDEEKTDEFEDVVLQQKNKRKRKRDDIDTDAVLNRKELKGLRVTKQVKILTVPLNTQEIFFLRHYNHEENEGGISSPDYERLGDHECDVNSSSSSSKLYQREKILETVLIDHCYYKPASYEEPQTQIEIPPSPTIDLHSINNPQMQCNIDVFRTPEQVQIQEQTNNNGKEFYEKLSRNSNDIEQFVRRKAAFLDWKSFIQPKINAASQKPDFNIHEYGTRIMDAIPLGKSRHFNHIIENKSAPEVSRFFAATLQLANTNNVQLENVPEGQLANGTLCIKLVNRERYHEQLEEYIAPSEEIRKACKSRSTISTISTPNKKIKIS